MDIGVSSTQLPRTSGGTIVRKLITVLCSVTIGVGALAGCTSPVERPTQSRAAGPTTEAPDIPNGLVDGGDGLAWQWLDHTDSEFDCSYYDACSMIKVFAYRSCPEMVYVSANVINSSGSVVDSTNDTLSSLSIGQTGLLRLGRMGSGGEYKFQLTELKCY